MTVPPEASAVFTRSVFDSTSTVSETVPTSRVKLRLIFPATSRVTG
jgi:hypothetical protein